MPSKIQKIGVFSPKRVDAAVPLGSGSPKHYASELARLAGGPGPVLLGALFCHKNDFCNLPVCRKPGAWEIASNFQPILGNDV